MVDSGPAVQKCARSVIRLFHSIVKSNKKLMNRLILLCFTQHNSLYVILLWNELERRLQSFIIVVVCFLVLCALVFCELFKVEVPCSYTYVDLGTWRQGCFRTHISEKTNVERTAQHSSIYFMCGCACFVSVVLWEPRKIRSFTGKHDWVRTCMTHFEWIWAPMDLFECAWNINGIDAPTTNGTFELRFAWALHGN